MILTVILPDVEVDISVRCGESADEIAGVLNRARSCMHPGVATDDAPFHSAMKAVAEEYDMKRKAKRKREHG